MFNVGHMHIGLLTLWPYSVKSIYIYLHPLFHTYTIIFHTNHRLVVAPTDSSVRCGPGINLTECGTSDYYTVRKHRHKEHSSLQHTLCPYANAVLHSPNTTSYNKSNPGVESGRGDGGRPSDRMPATLARTYSIIVRAVAIIYTTKTRWQFNLQYAFRSQTLFMQISELGAT